MKKKLSAWLKLKHPSQNKADLALRQKVRFYMRLSLALISEAERLTIRFANDMSARLSR